MEYEFHQSYVDTRSAGMAVASLILGITGVVLSCCVYPGIIFGSLAVILALLSRGGEKNVTGYATAGLVLGIIGIAAGICMFVYSLVTLYVTFGGWDAYINEIYRAIEQVPSEGYSNWYHAY